jgi:hypothetical protein
MRFLDIVGMKSHAIALEGPCVRLAIKPNNILTRVVDIVNIVLPEDLQKCE